MTTETSGQAPDSPEVNWQPSDLPLFTGEERDDAFAGQWPGIPPENLRWQAYHVTADDSPQLLIETKRWLRWPTWSTDGTRFDISYATRSVVMPNGPDWVNGWLGFDARDLGKSPVDIAVQLANLVPLPGSAKALLQPSTAPIVATPPGPPTFPEPRLLLVDALNRTARQLSGLPGRLSPASDTDVWSQDGAFVLVYANPGPAVIPNPNTYTQPPVQFYAVPVTGGKATLVQTIAANGITRASWSPAEPHMLAYLDAGALWLLDPGNGRRRRLTPDASFDGKWTPTWQLSGNQIQVGNQIVDVASGTITTYPSNDTGFVFAISPDARYEVTIEAAGGSAGRNDLCPGGRPPQNRVYLYDRSLDATRLLKDCDGRYAYSFQWLSDNRHVLMLISDSATESPNRSIVIKDVEAGEESPLTDGLEFGAWAVLSPAGDKVIVTGKSLRIFDAKGTLLRQIDPPAGFSVTAAAWSPDGRSFVYVVGPTGASGV